ncbi:MAG: HypC/HybG/HupF family hydrogenase formation chaperone [Thermoleophilia bacterium]|nr:HypC/HybG/HupF family hydrogenase formation chaperone [Thermoleophilia bacterium]
MCLAIPAKIVNIDNQSATVEVGGVTRQASIVLLPDARLGNYILIHAGFAISLVDEAEALETIKLFQQLSEGLDGENGPEPVQ